MFEPIDIESCDFQTRCQIRRMEGITGESRSQVIRKAIDEYYQRVMATATEEQLQAERDEIYKPVDPRPPRWPLVSVRPL